MTIRTGRALAAALLAVTVGLTLGACSSGSDGSDAGPKPKFIQVSFFPTSDPTGAVVDKGQEQAAKDLGVEVEYRAPAQTSTDPTELKRLLEGAIASKPAGIIFTDLVPQALNPIVKRAVDAGIPVILSYVSPTEAADTGALTIVGNDDVETGKLGARRLNELGAKHALMVTIPPGIPFVDKRGKGFTEAFQGKVTKLQLPPGQVINDPAASRGAIETALEKDQSIDAVFTLGTLLTSPMLAAKGRLGDRASDIKWAAVDMNRAELQGVQSGQLDFALDSQPYQTGYLSVLLLAQYVRSGITPASPEFPTGPVVVDKRNVSKVAQLVSAGK